MRRVVLFAGITLALTVGLAQAQVPTLVAWPSGEPTACSGKYSVTDLATSYYAGDWKQLQTQLKDLLTTSKCSIPGLSTKRDYLLVAFVATEPKPDPEVLHVLMHDGLPPFSTTLPGIGTKDTTTAKLWVVFLSDNRNVDIATLLTSTSTPNPIIAQIGDFAQKFDLAKFFPAARALSPEKTGETKPFARFKQVTLPYARATVAQADYVNLPADLTIGDDAAVRKFKERVTAISARFSAAPKVLTPCAVAVNDGVRDALVGATVGGVTVGGVNVATQWTELPGFIDQAITTATTSGCTSADFAQVQAVAADYRALVPQQKPTPVTGSATWTNQPLTWIDFTVGAGVLVGGLRGADKVTLDDNGAYKAADPLERAVTWVGVTFHLPYDSSRPSPSGRERVGVLAGGVLTPAGGFATGVSILVVRGFSVNVGGAWLIVSTRPDDKQIGDMPADKNKPFKTGIASGIFFGGNFTFK
jgi:hypothetical protein